MIRLGLEAMRGQLGRGAGCMADNLLFRLLGRSLQSIPRPSRAGAAASLAAVSVLTGSARAVLIEPASIAGFAFDLTKILTLSVTVGCVAAAALSFTLLLSRRGDTALVEA